MTRVAVVGAGVAGAMLSLRLAESGVGVDLFTGPGGPDASAASGGLVRGYEPDPAAAAVAAAAIAEVRADARLRDWSGYREIGSAYVTPEGAPPDPDALAAVHDRLPGSLRLAGPDELPLRGLPGDAVVVLETMAGHLSPARLRRHVLAELPGLGVRIHAVAVTAVAAGTVRAGPETLDGYRAVVVAAGAWTGRLTGQVGRLTTRHIQYGRYPATVPGLPSFVDETSGLYGRPHDDGRLLLGLSSDRWGVTPEDVVPDPELSARVTAVAARRLGVTTGPDRVVAAFDCYTEPAGLRLRPAGTAGVLTFTGGSGGAAKTVVAASRSAAAELAG